MSHALALPRVVLLVLLLLSARLVNKPGFHCVIHMQPGNSRMLGVYILLLLGYEVIVKGGLLLSLLWLLVHLLLVQGQLLVAWLVLHLATYSRHLTRRLLQTIIEMRLLCVLIVRILSFHHRFHWAPESLCLALSTGRTSNPTVVPTFAWRLWLHGSLASLTSISSAPVVGVRCLHSLLASCSLMFGRSSRRLARTRVAISSLPGLWSRLQVRRLRTRSSYYRSTTNRLVSSCLLHWPTRGLLLMMLTSIHYSSSSSWVLSH